MAGSAKRSFGEREFTAEVAFLKTRKSFEATAAQTLPLQSLVEDFEGRKWTLDQLRDGCCTFYMEYGESGFRRVGGKTSRKRRCFGPGADGEVLQAAVAIHADAPSAEAANGHRHLGGPVAAEGALGTWLEEFSGREWLRFAIHGFSVGRVYRRGRIGAGSRNRGSEGRG